MKRNRSKKLKVVKSINLKQECKKLNAEFDRDLKETLDRYDKMHPIEKIK